jgi:hypothetical protein
MSIKNQKGKLRKKNSPLLKNNIPNNLKPQKPVVYSRYSRCRVEDLQQGKIVKFFWFQFFKVKGRVLHSMFGIEGL